MAVRRIILSVMLGVVGAVGTTWVIAAAVPIPMYPRPTVSCFVLWGRAWNVAQAGPIGVTDNWWGEMWPTSGHIEGDAFPLLPVQIVEGTLTALRARTDPNRPREVLESPPRWGLFGSDVPPPVTLELGSDTAFGWPARCAWYQVTATLSGNTLTAERLDGGLLIAGQPSARGRSFRALPVRPLWTGLAINTLFYSLLGWVLLTVPGVLRRRRRRRLGRCIKCGYDLKGLAAGATCPECGRNPRTGPDGARAAGEQP